MAPQSPLQKWKLKKGFCNKFNLLFTYLLADIEGGGGEWVDAIIGGYEI